MHNKVGNLSDPIKRRNLTLFDYMPDKEDLNNNLGIQKKTNREVISGWIFKAERYADKERNHLKQESSTGKYPRMKWSIRNETDGQRREEMLVSREWRTYRQAVYANITTEINVDQKYVK